MLSQNFPRAPRNPRVEHVRVDRLTNRLIHEAEGWNNSRVFFDPNRYVPDERERFDRPIYRERSPLRRAFETAYPRNENPYRQYFTRATHGASHQFKILTFVITPERTALISSASRIPGLTRLIVNSCQKMNFMKIRQEMTTGQNTKTKREKLTMVALGGHRVASVLPLRSHRYPLEK